MKDLSRVKFNEDGRAYIERVIKSGKQKGYIRKFYGQIVVCQVCGEEHFTSDSNMKQGWGKSCSFECSTQGKNNPRWNGGKTKDGLGYILCWNPKHPHAKKQKYVYEHRLIVEKYLGRYLKPEEVVHHINGMTDDNHPQNLMGFLNNSVHTRFERNCPINSEDIIFDGRKISK